VAEHPWPDQGGPDLDAGAALRAAATAGDFFDLTGPHRDPAAGWRPLRDLVDDAAAMAEVVAAGRRAMARIGAVPPSAVEPRAAASVLFLGLAARLVAAPIGAAVLGGAVPLLTLDDVLWRPHDRGSPVLVAGPARAVPTDHPEQAAMLIRRFTVDGAVRPLLESFRLACRISPRVLWGNVASAVGGAVQVLVSAAPDRAPTAVSIGRRLLDLGQLAGTTQPLPPDAGRWPPRRRSCCLLYRVPGAGICTDCVLSRLPGG